MYIVFALVGVAWAAISVNSLPMVVEMRMDQESVNTPDCITLR